MLEVSGLSLRYGKHLALDGVGLRVGAGESVVILGANGAGKTSLLKAVAGLVAPEAGARIEFEGQPLPGCPAHAIVDLGIALVPEGRGVFGDLSVEENLILEAAGSRRFCNLGFLKGGVIRRNAKDKIERFDIRGADPTTTTRALSGGNMQKVILARVLSEQPKVILANQPTRGLDVGAAAKVQELLFEARAEGAGIILISEDLEELLQVSDRIAVLYQGRLSTPVAVEEADLKTLGLLMSGHGEFERRKGARGYAA